ncbi:MAG: alpha/beta hydrolase [Planctomycetaceae bacterium]|nr:alpha/beta hydrolase [Planctomycetaceae bacterium]
MPHFTWALLVVLLATPAFAQRADRSYPPSFPDAKTAVYKTASDTELRLYVFNPEGWKDSDRRPAVVFFFGGGWQNGSPTQFAEQSRYLAKRGMVAICADYRVASRQKVSPIECVEDARSAMAYVRENAARLGIDPQRIAAAGGSAGGHLAACMGVIEQSDQASRETTSGRANALVLFNPAVQLAAFEGDDAALGAAAIARMDDRTGGRAKEISPIHHVGEQEPPTLILHGVDDTTVPFSTVQRFGEVMRKHGNRCEVVGFKGAGHGFFNARRGDETLHKATTRLMDEFFVSLGWLDGEPSLPTSIDEDRLVREGVEKESASR